MSKNWSIKGSVEARDWEHCKIIDGPIWFPGSAIFLLLLNIISISSEEKPKIEQHRIWNDDGEEDDDVDDVDDDGEEDDDDDGDLIGQVGSTDCSVQSWGARLCSTFQTPGLPRMYKVFFFLHWASPSTENLG